MRTLNHVQVLNMLSAEDAIPSYSRQAIEQPIDPILKDYSPRALNGTHLCDAMEVYWTEVKNGAVKVKAFYEMQNKLMEHKVVSSTGIAQMIATWLVETFDEKINPMTAVDSIKLSINEKVKEMNASKPSLPPSLFKEDSSLRMMYKGNTLVPTISFGPAFPPEKYKQRMRTLEYGPKAFVISFTDCISITLSIVDIML